jgi:transcriptional regulator with PAS, ATPase and Fis domain
MKHRKVAVNCGAIPEGTIDSELAWTRKGSFTGATSTRVKMKLPMAEQFF